MILFAFKLLNDFAAPYLLELRHLCTPPAPSGQLLSTESPRLKGDSEGTEHLLLLPINCVKTCYSTSVKPLLSDFNCFFKIHIFSLASFFFFTFFYVFYCRFLLLCYYLSYFMLELCTALWALMVVF